MQAGPETVAAARRLEDAAWLEWPELRTLFTLFDKAGYEIRAVGGAVRDTLLGRDVEEVDLATVAEPDRVLALAAEAGLKTVPVGLAHGTVMVVMGARTFEITTLREDVETYGRHAKVAYSDDWAADAGRRDFTVNALYASADGTLHDPLGGAADLAARRIRFIGDADARIREDYLRILRFFRFNAEIGEPPYDARALKACGRQRHGVAGLSADRVRGELFRLLAAPGAVDAVATMADHGHLVAMLGGVVYVARFARLAALEDALAEPGEAVPRLAALAVAVEEDAERLAGILNLSRREARRLRAAAGYRLVAGVSGEAAAKEALYRSGATAFRDRFLLAAAAAGTVPQASVLDLPERWPVPKFPLRGGDLIAKGVARGPRISEILTLLEAHWIKGGFAGDRSALLAHAERLIRQGGEE